MQGPNANDGSTRDNEAPRDIRETRGRRLGDARRRIAALTRRAPDDVAISASSDAAPEELMAVVEELSTAYAQLTRQSEELEQTRQLLAAERERFRELFEIAPEGHVITNAAGTIRELNRGAAVILNLPTDYVIGKPLAVFVDPEDRRRFRVRMYRACSDGAEEAWTVRLQPRDSEPIRAFVAVSPLHDANGMISGLRWLIRDVSNQRAAAVWERAPAAVLRAALDALSTHVAVVDADGMILTVNSAWRRAARAAGLFADAGPGGNYLDLCAAAIGEGRIGAEVVRSTLQRVLRNEVQHAHGFYSDTIGDSADAESHENGSWFALRVSRCDGPEPEMIVVAHEDVTAENRAHARETALLRERTARAAAEAANRAKSEFLATLSHELRTPLNAIAGYAQLLEMGVRGPVTREQEEDLRRILRSEQHLLGLINDLLNFARIERGEVNISLTPVRVRDLTREVVELIEPQATAKSLHVTVSCADAELEAMADVDRLRQILLNLLTNAVKFTPAGGSIRVECRGDERVVICVHDTGIGIPESKQEVVFDPFVQVDRGAGAPSEGIGLGLAISRSLARAMGGDVVLWSEPGFGSTFRLSLTRAQSGKALS